MFCSNYGHNPAKRSGGRPKYGGKATGNANPEACAKDFYEEENDE